MLQCSFNAAATAADTLALVLTRDHQTSVQTRFRGFEGIAQGGYIAGLVANEVGAPAVEVKLRRPVRTEIPLTLERVNHDRVELRDGETLMAEGLVTELAITVPEPVSFTDAEAVSRRYPGLDHHLFPGCFGCGTARPDGLRMFAGPVPGRRLVAAPWVPNSTEADEAGIVPGELVWAALDCPQLWSLIIHAPTRASESIVTGTLAVKLERPVIAGIPHVVMAWPSAVNGRSVLADAALLAPDGEVCATGRQTALVADWGLPLGLARWRPNPLPG